MVFVQLSSR